MTVTTHVRARALAPAAFDLAERLALIALCTTTIMRIAPSLSTQPGNLVVLISEGLAVGMMLLRRPAVRADQSAYAALIALVGTGAPLLVAPAGPPLVAPLAGVVMMMAGLVWNIAAKVSLNRSFGLAAANRGVKRQGPYRFVRHPMYAGYMITQLGFLLMNPSPWNLGVYAVGWTVQILRIRAEETLLSEDPAYRAYAAATPYRLIPFLY